MADYIRRLEQIYRKAYGRDGMSTEPRTTLLHSQLQEGLVYDLMRAPAVSGAQGYRELCLAARNEERRLAELNKRREYQKPCQAVTQNQGFQKNNDRSGESRGWRKSQSATPGGDSRE